MIRVAPAPPSVELAPLWRLARACGVKPAYTNVRGERVRTAPEPLLHALRALGVDIHSIAGADEALRRIAAHRRQRIVEPVIVIWTRYSIPARARVEVQIPAESGDAVIRCTLAREDGAGEEWSVDLSEIRTTYSTAIDGTTMVSKTFELPGRIPVGYHELEIELSGQLHRSMVFVAPQRAYDVDHRGWRVFIPLYAVRSERNWGAGDLTDLRNLTAWAAELGGDGVGTLPLLAAFLNEGEPVEPSPYSPVSRLFWNELYIDVEAAPEFEQSREAQQIVGSSEYINDIDRLRRVDRVEYQSIMRLKRRVLERLADAFFSDARRRDALDRELRRNPDLDRYAWFRAATEAKRATWRSWPTDESQENSEGDLEQVRRYHLYSQLLCAEQLASTNAGHGLYLDLPVGVHPDGFDTWRYRDSFIDPETASAGAPPDDFFVHGQNWGLLPLHPQRIRENGHAYFRAVLRQQLRFAKGLRIDHVMWLHRLYWAPNGAPANEGVYVRYPAEELHAALCIESHRAGAWIAGENLGTVPDYVNRTMERHGVRPLYVAQFEWSGSEQAPLHAPPEGSIASLNTHDMPTFAAAWLGHDIDSRLEHNLLTDEQAVAEREGRESIRRSVLRFLRTHGVRLSEGGRSAEEVLAIAAALVVELAASKASVILVSLEDLWAETQPHNIPGVSHEANFCRKASRTFEELRAMPQVLETLRKMTELTRP